MSIINCVESILKSNTEAHLRVMLVNYSIDLFLHRIERGSSEIISVETVADVSGSLNGKYFLIYSPKSSYYIWYDILGTATDPNISGKISVKVSISENDDENVIATKTTLVLNTLQDFEASVEDNVITIKNRMTGDTVSPNSGDSGFTTATVTEGEDPDPNIEYLDVYGKKAAPVTKPVPYTITGIITGDQLIPVDGYTAGLFTRGWLFTESDEVRTGDTLDFIRGDDRKRRFVVSEPHILGSTTEVFRKWALEAIAS